MSEEGVIGTYFSMKLNTRLLVHDTILNLSSLKGRESQGVPSSVLVPVT